MRAQGILKSVLADGYERLLEVVVPESDAPLWVSALEPDQWRDPGEESQSFRVGKPVDLELVLRYVVAVLPCGQGEPAALLQPNARSPHTVLLGKVSRILEPDSFECSIGSQVLRVELERDKSLSINQWVKVSGELASAG